LAGITAAVLLLCPGAEAQEKRATMILRNAQVLTLDPMRPRAEALAVRDGRIVAIGDDAEVMLLRGEGTQVLDLQGRVLMPSLKDHHLHVVNIGFAALNRERHQALFLDLSGAKSEDDVARMVAERAAQQPRGTWVLGTGWNQISFGTQKLPTHHALSKAAPEHPVFLVRVDAHSAWVNQAALDAAGITRDTADPHGGQILRLEDGAPSGVVLERAAEPFLARIPEPSDADITAAFRLGAQVLAAQGLTEVYDAGFLPFPGIVAMNIPLERYYDLLRKLDAAEPLPLRINLMVPLPTSLGEAVLRDPAAFRPSPRLRVTHIKLFADGAMGSRGAAQSKPFADDPSQRGVFRMTAEELQRDVRRALEAGLDVATHAIGDAAVERVLDVYAGVLAADPSLVPRRLRIEHFSYASQKDIRRAAHHAVLLCIQPGFVWPNDEGLTMEDSRVGRENSAGAYAFASLADLGAVLTGSSDDFTLPQHPLWNFYAAATRMNPEGKPAGGWHPEERLPRQAALQLFTDFAEPGGSVARGMLREDAAADFVVLTGNPLKVAENEILKIRVIATIRAGVVTHGSEALAAR
jgi:predicted amidohydrolase YtcJ